METSKQNTSSSVPSSSSSSSSSICLELFGPKETPPSSSSPTSTTSVFGSVFGPPPTGRGTESPYTKGNGGTRNQESVHPWHYSSSIYYGGQDFYATSSVDTKPQYKKVEQDGDSDGSNPHGAASRGNWWQGSLYY